MFNVNNQTFRTKKALTEAIHKLVDRSREGEPLVGDDFEFVLDLLSTYHPNGDEKIGSGVESLHVAVNPDYPNTRCFWITRTDGTTVNFSWRQCLTPRSRRQDFDKACRSAVKDQTIGFREDYFLRTDDPKCAVTGEALGVDNCHVDHVTPFKTLVDRFLDEHSIDIEASPINDGEDKVTRPFTDDAFAQKWSDYHRQHAVLRCVTRDANLGLLRRAGSLATSA